MDLWPYNAKHLGAYVATTVGTNDKQFVQGLGADQVIDYKTENFADMTHNYDAVFDTVGGDTYKRSFKVLKKGSSMIVSMLEQPNSRANDPAWNQSNVPTHSGSPEHESVISHTFFS